jgi:ribA/ribD-fused uncharacterized protein
MYKKVLWKSSEHIYQAEKTLDPLEQTLIHNAETPSKAKRIGFKVELRDGWDNIKCDTMRVIVYEKFHQNKFILKSLLDTDHAILIEGNYWHDNYWGDCSCPKCKNITGENHLGLILMDLRHFFREKEDMDWHEVSCNYD